MKKNRLVQGQTYLSFSFDTGVFNNAPKKEEQTEDKQPFAKAKSPAKSSKEQSALLKFYKENNGIVIDDSSNEAISDAKKSRDFTGFCRKLKNALKKEAILKGFDDVTLKMGHYDMYGFMQKGKWYVYYSFAVSRYNSPTMLDGTDPLTGFLYRMAKNDKDFTGGQNHFTDLLSLLDRAYELIEREEEKEKENSEKDISLLTEDEIKELIESKTGISFNSEEGKYNARVRKNFTIRLQISDSNPADSGRMIHVFYDVHNAGGVMFFKNIDETAEYINKLIERHKKSKKAA